jgi:hypothetical protein
VFCDLDEEQGKKMHGSHVYLFSFVLNELTYIIFEEDFKASSPTVVKNHNLAQSRCVSQTLILISENFAGSFDDLQSSSMLAASYSKIMLIPNRRSG